jgi:hypothetical protein
VVVVHQSSEYRAATKNLIECTTKEVFDHEKLTTEAMTSGKKYWNMKLDVLR